MTRIKRSVFPRSPVNRALNAGYNTPFEKACMKAKSKEEHLLWLFSLLLSVWPTVEWRLAVGGGSPLPLGGVCLPGAARCVKWQIR